MKKFFIRPIISLTLSMAAACVGAQANAEMLTFAFSGTLTEVVGDPGSTDGWGVVGDPFWGTLSYDPTWQNSNNGHLNNTGDYAFYDYALERDPPERAITLSLSTPSLTR